MMKLRLIMQIFLLSPTRNNDASDNFKRNLHHFSIKKVELAKLFHINPKKNGGQLDSTVVFPKIYFSKRW